MKSAWKHIKYLNSVSKAFRTCVQAMLAYLSINIFTVMSGSANLRTAVETLLIGAIAAGFSAVWKAPTENPEKE